LLAEGNVEVINGKISSNNKVFKNDTSKNEIVKTLKDKAEKSK
jgi:hypothetical protein